MKIIGKPRRRAEALTLERTGDVLTFNGKAFDFGPLPEGATLPRDAVDCPWLASDVERIDGALQLTIHLPFCPPVPWDTSRCIEILYPPNGPVPLPAYTPPPDEDANDDD